MNNIRVDRMFDGGYVIIDSEQTKPLTKVVVITQNAVFETQGTEFQTAGKKECECFCEAGYCPCMPDFQPPPAPEKCCSNGNFEEAHHCYKQPIKTEKCIQCIDPPAGICGFGCSCHCHRPTERCVCACTGCKLNTAHGHSGCIYYKPDDSEQAVELRLVNLWNHVMRGIQFGCRVDWDYAKGELVALARKR